MTAIAEIVLDAAVRSTAVAVFLWVPLKLFRTRDAGFRKLCWTILLAAMLSMPLLVAILPSIYLPLLPASEEFPRADSGDGSAAFLILYLTVALFLVLRTCLGYWLGWRVIRSATPLDSPPFRFARRCGLRIAYRESAAVSVPLTFGWWRPAIVLPANWREWEPRKLAAVLHHELGHAERRDFAVALLASLNRAVYWFHPVAWWLNRQLAELAEQASDEAAAQALGDSRYYAEILLQFAADVSRQGSRLSWQPLAMARPGQLDARISHVLGSPDLSSRRMGRSPRVLAACLAALLAATMATVQLTEAYRAPSSPFPPPPPPPPPRRVQGT